MVMVVIAMFEVYSTHMSFRDVAEQFPLVLSTQETKKAWPKMGTTARMGACAASAITMAGPIARLFIESGREKGVPPSKMQIAAGIAVDLRDGLDGKVARATGGVTAFGRELDPFADKLDFAIQEGAECLRGELPWTHFALRAIRDIAITGLRSHVMKESDGEANVGAKGYGKASTAVRQTSLRITGSPLEHPSPHFRKAHQLAATGLLLYSGIQNARTLLGAKKEYSKSKKAA